MADYVLLFLGAVLAAAISGAAGFGGGLLLLPLLTHTVGVARAVPLLTVAQLIGNLSRAAFGLRQIRWRPVLLFLATAIPFAVLGAWSFVAMPKALVMRLVGAAILGFVLLRAFGLARFRPGPRLLLVGGAAVGLLSGLVGSAGPLGAAVFLALDLPPVAYVSSEAVTAIGMHLAKTIVYGATMKLEPAFWGLAVALGLAMVLGTWASRRMVEKLPVAWFRRLVGLLLAVIAVQMIVTG